MKKEQFHFIFMCEFKAYEPESPPVHSRHVVDPEGFFTMFLVTTAESVSLI